MYSWLPKMKVGHPYKEHLKASKGNGSGSLFIDSGLLWLSPHACWLSASFFCYARATRFISDFVLFQQRRFSCHIAVFFKWLKLSTQADLHSAELDSRWTVEINQVMQQVENNKQLFLSFKKKHLNIFSHQVSIFAGLFSYLNWRCKNRGGLCCADCKVLWGKFESLGYIYKTDLTCLLSSHTVRLLSRLM